MKDLFDTAGIRTTYGSAVFADHVPPAPRRRCACSRRPAGRTSARRTCTSSPTASPRRTSTTARCRTRRPGRTAGGSSGGSAAALVRGGRRGARHRHRRLDPDPRRVLRDRRLQAVLRARADRRCLPARPELRPRGPDGARRRGLRRAAARAGSRLRHRRRLGGSASASPGSTGANRSSARGCWRSRRSSHGGIGRLSDRRGGRPRVHARGRRRPPRALPDPQRPVRREHRRQDRALPGVTDAEYGAAQRARRSTRTRRRGARGIRPPARADAGLRRTARRRRRARGAGASSSSSRSRSTRSAGPRWPCRAGRPRTDCPHRSRSSAGPGADALVLAAGLTLEGALKA